MTFEEVLAFLSNVMKVAASPGGLEALTRILGPARDEAAKAAAALKDAPPTQEVPPNG